ncbi:MAG: DNA polymerase III subunit delta' [Rhodospirillales bacterium]|jgi:DNA polymerase III subunit delta'|nr:DNA polymerase III subunit delta' [Rhodospirillales bacterium]
MSPAKTNEIDIDDVPPPRENPDLIGHDAAEHELLDAFNSGRMSHAWLICGPRGIGKATLAFRFARFVLSQGSSGGGGGLFADDQAVAAANGIYISPESAVFRRVAAQGHADLMTVERGISDTGRRKPRTEIVVSDVRRIGPFLSMTPAEGGWRVVVIDGADLMNRSAMNAVLKVLEEPPQNSLLLLACHNPGRLLPTVRSRCRMLNMNPLPPETVETLLHRFAPGIAPADTAALAKLSEGSIGRALTLADEGGLELYRELMALLGTLPNLDAVKLHEFADRLARAGAENAFRTVTELLQNWLAGVIRSAAGGASDEDFVHWSTVANAGSLDRWLQVWEKVTHLLARSDRANLDRKQVVLSAVLAIESAARG